MQRLEAVGGPAKENKFMMKQRTTLHVKLLYLLVRKLLTKYWLKRTKERIGGQSIRVAVGHFRCGTLNALPLFHLGNLLELPYLFQVHPVA
jgi:hypothetical protein